MLDLKTVGAFVLLVLLEPFAIVGRVILEVVHLLFIAVLFFLAAGMTIVDLCLDLFKGGRA
jgi:hypothetical protein